MRKHVFAFVVFILACPLLQAADTNFLTSVSPNLKKFLIGHRPAMHVLTNALAETFSNRTVRLYYYYSDDPDDRGAGHFYPNTVGMPDIVICVAQNAYPVDEFIGILYETLNSRGQKRFEELVGKARSGTISKPDFAKGILKIEFDALITARELLLRVRLGKKEIKHSHYYRSFVDMPTDFDRYLTWQKSLFPTNHGPMEEYESNYDLLRKSEP